MVSVPDVKTALGELAAAYRRHLALTVIGVTGSNGKTTTKEMLRLVLGPSAAASPQSYNNEIGVPLTLLGVKRSHSYCIVEMGTNAPGEIARLAQIARPDIGVVLNVSESHLEGLGDVAGVAREKFSLVEHQWRFQKCAAYSILIAFVMFRHNRLIGYLVSDGVVANRCNGRLSGSVDPQEDGRYTEYKFAAYFHY